MIAETIFSFILIMMGILFFAFGLVTFILSFEPFGSTGQGILYAGQYMILGILLTGSGIYINNKRGWASR